MRHAAFGAAPSRERHQAVVPVEEKLRETLLQHRNAEYRDRLKQYVEWAERHLVESDPFRGFASLTGNRPDLTHHDWRDWDARNPQRW